MEDLMDMILTDESPSQISDTIKSALFSKSAERVDAFRPDVASTMFADDAVEEDEEEVEAETETEVEAEAETEIGDEE
jgi:hypothetical protein|tara:strand:+ start:550 stop:783 length:234 start_codon:yes stop_codon:yes gene_type:complete